MTSAFHGVEPGSEQMKLPVLVVDDNPTNKALTCVYLMQALPFDHGLEVECANDGEEAIQKIRGKQFALMVMGWKKPLMGDGQLLRQLREERMRLPVVVVSGLSREEIGVDLESLGAVFLHKDQLTPVSLQRAIAASMQLQGLSIPSETKHQPSR